MASTSAEMRCGSTGHSRLPEDRQVNALDVHLLLTRGERSHTHTYAVWRPTRRHRLAYAEACWLCLTAMLAVRHGGRGSGRSPQPWRGVAGITPSVIPAHSASPMAHALVGEQRHRACACVYAGSACPLRAPPCNHPPASFKTHPSANPPPPPPITSLQHRWRLRGRRHARDSQRGNSRCPHACGDGRPAGDRTHTVPASASRWNQLQLGAASE